MNQRDTHKHAGRLLSRALGAASPPSRRDNETVTSAPISVLLVGKGPPDRGGIAASLEMLASSTLSETYSIDLLNLTRDEVPGARKLTANNIRRTLSDTAAVWRAARGRDVVHCHLALARYATILRGGALATAARLRGSRVIIHAHSGRVEGWFSTPMRRRFARWTLRAVDQFVAVAGGGYHVLKETFGPRRVVLIENGVDCSLFRPSDVSHSLPRVLFAGVLTPRKGITDLLEASDLLMQRGVAHELLIAGGTPEEGQGAEAAVRGGASPHVHFLGPQAHDKMPSLYQHADVFCLPSWGEAMPLSVLEAMASGRPVVASAVGDIPRIIQDGASGFLVPPRHPAALADALEKIVLDVDLRRRMGVAARAYVQKRYDASGTLAALEDLYASVMEKK